MLRELINNLSNNSNGSQQFGYLDADKGLANQKVSSHLSACICEGCQSLVINKQRLSPAPTLNASSTVAASMPLLSSNPNATAKLFLDFNGHTTSDTAWNTNFNGGAAFTTPAYSVDADSNFSATEISNITEIWKRVAEDFAPFNIDVTTIDPDNMSAANNMRVVIGGAWDDWFEESEGAGGVAYLFSWQNSGDTPAFVFEENLANGHVKYTAEAISHEAGHTLGLYHQSKYSGTTRTDGYNPGGNGWAPIMGNSYSQSLTTWHNGPNSEGYNNFQDDMSVIASSWNGFGGYRADDRGNTNATAAALTVSGTSVSGSGIIAQNDDIDVFSFTTGAGTINLNLAVASVGANLDAVLELYNSNGTLVASHNPTDTQSASISQSVAAGNYFLHVKSNGSYGRVGQYSISGTISDTNGTPSPSTFAIAATNAVQMEGNSGAKPFTFTITRGGGTGVANSVSWAVTGNGANPASTSDFSGVPSGTVNFAAGETSKVVTVNVVGDTVTEQDENFIVTLSNPTGGASIIAPTATGTIQNDDIPATFAIAATNAVQTEGNSSTKPFTFTITRGGGTGLSNSVKWAVTGSGTNPASATDFSSVFPSGTVNFAAGETSKVVTVNVKGDISLEQNEEFTVTLSSPTGGASIIAPTATGIIQNDDSPATLAIAATNAVQTEGNSGNKSFTFTVNRTGDTTGTSTASWSVAGSGTNPADTSDFSATSGTVSFSAGQTSKTVTVGVKGDAIAELDENFTVTLSNPSVGTAIGATATATGTIRNDDAIVGTAGNDTLNGFSGNDTISGLAGQDRLFGLAGNDSIDGGLDNDILTGGVGNDTLLGNSGNDTLVGIDTAPGATSFGINEIDRLSGSVGSDRFILGDTNRTYYVGNGMSDYVLITDFGTGDVIQKYGSDTLTIGGTLPTGVSGRAIYLGSDLVAVVQGTVPTLASFVDAA
jgi:hypothetical protein